MDRASIVPASPTRRTTIVAEVERRCGASGARLTLIRRRVLQELAGSRVALTAYELAARLGSEKRLAPVQVYRTLEFLQGIGAVHRLATRGAYVVREPASEAGEAGVFLVCRTCGGVAETGSPEVERGLAAVSARAGFGAVGRVVEVEGECAACRVSPS